MKQIQRITLHPLKEDGTIDVNVNLYPKTLVDGIVDREGKAVDFIEQSELDAVNTKLSKSIKTETNRATAAEAILTQGLAEEVTIRETADIALHTDIAAEATRASSRESQLAASISSEITRASNAEASLTQAISEEAEARSSTDIALQNNINTEAAVRASADTVIAQNLTDEAATRNTADAALRQSINAEVSERQSAISSLTSTVNSVSTGLSDEVTRATAQEESLSAAITAEVSRATTQEQSLSSTLTTHTGATNNPHSVTKAQVGLGNVDNTSDANKPISTATQAALSELSSNLSTASTTLQQAITTETTARTQAVSSLDTQLSGEVTSRQAADDTLQSNIDTEETARLQADSALQSAIEAEETARIAAISGVQSSITSEASTRASAVSALQTAVSNEVTARSTADTTLQTNITTVDDKLNYNAHIEGNSDEISYNGDTVTKVSPYRNLKTGITGSRSESIHLANDTTAGLMSHNDYNQIRTNTARIEALEGQTRRLLYTTSANPSAQDIQDFVDDYLQSIGITPSPSEYAGIAVVVSATFHVWHYYNDANVGWRDDGTDTVTQFTNSVPGIIKGAGQTDGSIYAESDGTGSVYGWDALKTRVSNTETSITSLGTNKVDKVSGKGLSTNDFTTAYKDAIDANTTKLSGIATGAQVNVIETIKVKDSSTTTLIPDNKAVTIDISAKADASALSSYLPRSGKSSNNTIMPLTGPIYIDHNELSFIGNKGAFGFRAAAPAGATVPHLGQINLSKNFGGDGNQYGIQMSAVDITNNRFNQFRVYQEGIAYQLYNNTNDTVSNIFTVDTSGKINKNANGGGLILPSTASLGSNSEVLATETYVTGTIDTLDATITDGSPASLNIAASRVLKTLSETNGIISATFQDIQIAESQVTNLSTDLGTINTNIGSINTNLGTKVAKTQTIAGVDLQDNVTKSELLTALNVADGAQVNVIESIYLNDDLITPNINKEVGLYTLTLDNTSGHEEIYDYDYDNTLYPVTRDTHQVITSYKTIDCNDGNEFGANSDTLSQLEFYNTDHNSFQYAQLGMYQGHAFDSFRIGFHNDYGDQEDYYGYDFDIGTNGFTFDYQFGRYYSTIKLFGIHNNYISVGVPLGSVNGLVLPDTSSWQSTKTIATTSDFSVTNTSSSKTVTANGTTLTFGSNAFNSTTIPTTYLKSTASVGRNLTLTNQSNTTTTFSAAFPEVAITDKTVTSGLIAAQCQALANGAIVTGGWSALVSGAGTGDLVFFPAKYYWNGTGILDYGTGYYDGMLYAYVGSTTNNKKKNI